MKFKWNDDDQKYIKLALTAFAVVILSILANQVLHQLPLLTEGVKKLFGCLRPIIYGMVFAYLLSPLLNFTEKALGFLFKKLGIPEQKTQKHVRMVSVLLSWGITFVFAAVLVKMVVPELKSSVNGIITNMPVYVNKITRWVSDLLKDNPEIRTKLVIQIRELYSDINSLLDSVYEIIPNIGSWVGNVSNGVFNVVYVVFHIVIGVIISIYILNSKEKFIAQTKKIMYSVFSVDNANSLAEFARSAHRKFGGFFLGNIIDSIIIGILCGVLLAIFRIPYAVLIGFIVGITNIIPFFGPFIGAIPSAILVLLAEPIKCVYFVIIIIVLQQFDGNILGPKILSNSIGISSFWIMFSILVFGGLFGFWGLLCGVPLFAVIYDVVSNSVKHKLERKNLSGKTADYDGLKNIDPETGEMIKLKEKE